MATNGRGRGFASMDKRKQRLIASKGGKAAHKKGTAHKWTSEEAREAGKIGGRLSRKNNRQCHLVYESDDYYYIIIPLASNVWVICFSLFDKSVDDLPI